MSCAKLRGAAHLPQRAALGRVSPIPGHAAPIQTVSRGVCCTRRCLPLSSIAVRAAARLTLLLLLLSPLRAVADPSAVAGRCSVKLFATTTLHDFEGTAPCALFSVDPRGADGSYRARVEIAVADIDTGIDARNTRMRKMFDAQRHPRIVGVFDHVDPAKLRAGALGFRLAIRGVERPVAPSVSAFRETPEKSAAFHAAFDVSLRDFGLEAPVVMGFVKVDDRVRVEVDVELTPRPAAAAR